MWTTIRCAARLSVVLAGIVAAGCSDAPTTATRAPAARRDAAVQFWDALSTTRWNRRATDLLQQLPAPPNGQAWASRMLAYLSLAQYRAVLAATAPSNRPVHASVSAAVARASVTVLEAFFTTSSVRATIEQEFVDDQQAPGWPGEQNQDVSAGDAIGISVGLATVAQSTHDGYLSLPAPTPPVGPAYWIPNGPAVRSLWGATPFFLHPQDLLLSPAPPAFGSPGFQAALDEVLAIVTSRTQEQLDIANKWNRVPPNGPFTAGEWNRRGDDLIQSHHRTEAEAARILAYANAAAFDAQIDCFTTKFYWWVIRPPQANSAIAPLLAFAMPNHPSYPSGHSCISSAFAAMLSNAFPSERLDLDATMKEAGLSRIYAGIHYRFDVEAGQGVGRRAAAKALAGKLE